MMDKDTAAEEFAKMLFRVGVEEGLETFFDSLGAPGGQNKKAWEDAKQWYENESEEGKRFVRFVAKEAIIRAVFGLAVNFDGATGYSYVGERPIEYVIAMRVYESVDVIGLNSPDETIEICPTTHGDDVHDIFLNLVDKAE